MHACHTSVVFDLSKLINLPKNDCSMQMMINTLKDLPCCVHVVDPAIKKKRFVMVSYLICGD